MNGTCWKCGTSLNALEYGRQDSCHHCGKDTHVCLNCLHHDRTCNNECRESQAERVVDKEKGSFCDYFKPKSGTSVGGPTKDHLKAAAEALFGGKKS